jgi:hypothetical protein
MVRLLILFLIPMLLNSPKALSQLNLRGYMDTNSKRIILPILPQNFYSQHLGFFCKQELQVQKAMALPLYFRLGSKDYVDYLERKPNAVLGDKLINYGGLRKR